MRSIKAIETIYKGRYFRSRLEARWAVFFDAIGLPWNYEMVGMDVNGERHLPDFELPTVPCHVEIKPSALDDKEARRINALQAAWGGSSEIRNGDAELWIIQGLPTLDENSVAQYRIMTSNPPIEPAIFAQCRKCDDGLALIAYADFANQDEWLWWRGIGIHSCVDNERAPLPPICSQRIIKAHNKALCKKFDHLQAVEVSP